MSEIDIPLSRRYEAHGKTFDKVFLREPKLRDHFAIGDPVEVHSGPDGEGRFVVEQVDRVAAYLERLCVAEKPGLESVQDLDLVDSIAVKQAIIGFFIAARTRSSRPTSSSSGPDKTSQA